MTEQSLRSGRLSVKKLDRLFSGRHALMTVANDCRHDTRVIKEAESLANAGFSRVSVVCLASREAPVSTFSNGVHYVRVGAAEWQATRNFGSASFPIKLARFARAKLGTFWRLLREQAYRRFNQSPGILQILRGLNLALLPLTRARQIEYVTGERFRRLALETVIDLKPDFLHCHDLATLKCGVEANKILGNKLIYDSHELETERNASYDSEVWQAMRAAEREQISQCDATITVSDSIADHLAAMYSISRPHVVFNAPRLTDSIVSQDNIRDHLKLSSEDYICVYVGKVGPNRGIEACTEALQHLPARFHIALVGPRDPVVSEGIRRTAARLGISNRIHLVDPVSPSEVVSFIGTADASLILIPNVCLSYYYCMPNKLFESLFAGVPVVASNLKDMGDFIREHRCGVIVEELTATEIAKALDAISSAGEQAGIAQDSALLREKYSWAAQESTLFELYADLASSGSDRAAADGGRAPGSPDVQGREPVPDVGPRALH